MRIFFAFAVIMASALLLALPLTGLIYDFRTDIQGDEFSVSTGAGVTTANVILSKELYGDDVQTIDLSSNITETVLYSSYNTTTRLLGVSGLTANSTRTLSVDYDVSALESAGAIGGVADRLPGVWLLMIIALPPAALAAIFIGRS